MWPSLTGKKKVARPTRSPRGNAARLHIPLADHVTPVSLAAGYEMGKWAELDTVNN